MVHRATWRKENLEPHALGLGLHCYCPQISNSFFKWHVSLEICRCWSSFVCRRMFKMHSAKIFVLLERLLVFVTLQSQISVFVSRKRQTHLPVSTFVHLSINCQLHVYALTAMLHRGNDDAFKMMFNIGSLHLILFRGSRVNQTT